MIAASRTFHGHFHGHVAKGERQVLVTVALPHDVGLEFLAALGPRPHRWQSIPIAMVTGGPAAALAEITADEGSTAGALTQPVMPIPGDRHHVPDAEVAQSISVSPALAEPAHAPVGEFDVGTAVARIAWLTVRILEPLPAEASDQEHYRREMLGARLTQASDALTAHFRTAAPGRAMERA